MHYLVNQHKLACGDPIQTAGNAITHVAALVTCNACLYWLNKAKQEGQSIAGPRFTEPTPAQASPKQQAVAAMRELADLMERHRMRFIFDENGTEDEFVDGYHLVLVFNQGEHTDLDSPFLYRWQPQDLREAATEWERL